MPPEEEKGPLSVSHGDEHQSDKAPIFESIGERDEQDLPPRYYRSINFIGTMFAAQSAFAGVSPPLSSLPFSASNEGSIQWHS